MLHALSENFTDNAFAQLCDEIFDQFHLFDETLRHIHRVLKQRHQSNTVKSATTFLPVHGLFRGRGNDFKSSIRMKKH